MPWSKPYLEFLASSTYPVCRDVGQRIIIQNFLLVGIITASILTPYGRWNSSSVRPSDYCLQALQVRWRTFLPSGENAGATLWPHYISRSYVKTHLSNALFKKADQEIGDMGSRPTQFIVVKSTWIATSLRPSNSLRVSSCLASFPLVHSLIMTFNGSCNLFICQDWEQLKLI